VRRPWLDGTAVVKSSSGDTWIGVAEGELRANAANGSIAVDVAHGGVVAKSDTGDVWVGEVVRGSVVLETKLGDVEVGIREGTAAWLDVTVQRRTGRQFARSDRRAGVAGRDRRGDRAQHRRRVRDPVAMTPRASGERAVRPAGRTRPTGRVRSAVSGAEIRCVTVSSTPTAAEITVGEAFYDVLRHHGVRAVFGNPGSNELPFLRDLPTDLPYYLALHEGAAVAMADGYAQASGSVGFVNLHAASGTANGLGCLTNTASSHTPLVITAGQQARRYVPLEALLTNVDAIRLCDPLVKWAGEPLHPQDGPLLAAKACHLARCAPAGPVYLSVPLDDWWQPADEAALGQLLNRSVHGDPVVDGASISALAAVLRDAVNPVLVLGAGVDTQAGFAAAVDLAEKARLPVWIAPSPSRAPFPTRHRCFRGRLPSAAGALAQALAGHDVILSFGAPVFRYHEPSDGGLLPPGAELYGVTDDPDEASRAPFGHLVVGDPEDAIVRVAAATQTTVRPCPETSVRAVADSGGPGFTAEAILDAVNDGKSADAVVSLEWTSAAAIADRIDITREKSLYFPAAGALGWGLPAAVGIQLAQADRPVLGLIGDGALHYTASALWTAARHQVPVTFVIAANAEYAGLVGFSQVLDVPPASYLDIPGLDAVKIAEAYGITAQRIEDLAELTDVVEAGMAATGPRLVEVPQRMTANPTRPAPRRS
jgi:benzoylformate decarboxylase